ncbi:hypothetical protein AAVH_21975 [Aphelenchoides avenae]|nr:hypothetical protein AAVH_21975 [Aphelenchus avenae]
MDQMLMIAGAVILGLAICVVLAAEETLPEIDDRDDVVVEPAGLPLPDQTNEDLIPIDFIDLPLTDDEGDGL